MNSNMAKNIIIAFNPYNASIIGNEKTATIDPPKAIKTRSHQTFGFEYSIYIAIIVSCPFHDFVDVVYV